MAPFIGPHGRLFREVDRSRAYAGDITGSMWAGAALPGSPPPSATQRRNREPPP